MPDAYTNLLVHVVFSTKNRDKNLTGDVRRELWPYLAALAKECRAKAYAVNGGLEHVHLLVSIPPTLTVADLMKFLKRTRPDGFAASSIGVLVGNLAMAPSA